MYFFVLKVGHFLLYLGRGWGYFFGRVYRIFRSQTRGWTIFVAVIEVNSVTLTYGAAIQMLYLGVDSFFDKLNLVLMYLLLFSVVAYSLVFYNYIYS